MPPRDADATRKRILDAATAEFAQHGLAGARIDRIADAAAANKRMIYAYYGNKDQLFDTVIETGVEHVHADVPFTPHDLVDYAGRLFDYVAEHPDLIRIDAWRRLERPGSSDREAELYEAKVDALAAARPNFGVDGRFTAADVLSVLLALAMTWFNAPEPLRRLGTAELAHQRDLVVSTVRVLAERPTVATSGATAPTD